MNTVTDEFRRRVETAPDRPAVQDTRGDNGCELMTYGQLESRAVAYAQGLVSLGVSPGDAVGLDVSRQPDMIAATLGILLAGAVYVPLDPESPPARIEFILRDSRVRWVLSDGKRDFGVPQGCAVVQPARLAQTPASGVTLPALTPDDPAYIMYTSGSTGNPKGVLVPHRAIVRLVVDASYVNLDSSCRVLQLAPVSFDAATFEIWGPLLNGGCCVLYPGEGAPSMGALRRVLRDHHVTTMWLTASLFNALVDEDASCLEGVRQILTGGEALSVPHVRAALDRLPDTQLINGYGPTEGTTFTCCYSIPREFRRDSASVPIGKPINGTNVLIVDENGHPVQDGETGFLYIGGLGVAKGYVNRPELTASVFVDNPGGETGRFYNSGDLVRRLPDGNIEFVGRRDHQIKLRGHRIELGEIEAALRELETVRDCAVSLIGENGHRRLVAYYTSDVERQPAELRTALSVSVPDYMVPADWVWLERLPVTSNGKLDRAALPAPAKRVAQAPHRSSTSAGNPLRDRIAELVRDILDAPSIGGHDRFFEIGLTSLDLLRAVSGIEKEIGEEIPLVTLFDTGSIVELADRIQQEHPTAVERWLGKAGIAAGSTLPSEAVFTIRKQSRSERLKARRARRRGGSS